MNKLKCLFLFITLSIIVFSCGKNDDEVIVANIEEEEQPIIMVCETDITDFEGTICCVLGPVSVIPGDQYNYTYGSNRGNDTFKWEVISGSITIVSGQNTSEVTLLFGEDFTSGSIFGEGSGDARCSEIITIVKR